MPLTHWNKELQRTATPNFSWPTWSNATDHFLKRTNVKKILTLVKFLMWHKVTFVQTSAYFKMLSIDLSWSMYIVGILGNYWFNKSDIIK